MRELALLHATPGLRRSDLRLRAAFARYARTHRAGPVIRAVRAQDRDLSALRTKVRRSSASTADGARARRDIVAGLEDILRSNYGINAHLRRQGAGRAVPLAAAHGRAARPARQHALPEGDQTPPAFLTFVSVPTGPVPTGAAGASGPGRLVVFRALKDR